MPVTIDRLISDPKTGAIRHDGEHTIDYIDVVYHDYPTNRQYSCHIQNIPGIVILFEAEEYDKHNEITHSIGRQKLLQLMGDDQGSWLKSRIHKFKPNKLEDDPYGPGTMLHNMLKKIGIKATPNCSCLQRAIEMNKKGSEWCEQNMGIILDWLKEESQKRNIPFIRTAAKLLVQRAIKQSKKYNEKRRLQNNN